MQRFIGIVLGGVTIYVLLLIMDAVSTDTQPKYLTAIIVGLLVALLYPWVIGFFLVRRAKDRRDEEIQAEVERQLADERAKSNPG